MQRCTHSPGSGELSNACQDFWGGQVGGEAREASDRSTGPRQGTAGGEVGRGGDEGLGRGQAARRRGEGGEVGRQAAELLRQVATQGQDCSTKLGQLCILQTGASRVHISGFGFQGGLSSSGPCRGLHLGLSEEGTHQGITDLITGSLSY